MRVIIAGAGISGLAAAERFSAIGADVIVVEKAPGPRDQGYMIDFFGPGYDAADATGLTPRLHELGYHITGASYVDEKGRERARLDVESVADVVDRRFVSIMRPDLERALRDQLPDDVDLRYGAAVTDVVTGPDDVTVRLSTGDTVRGDLLIGADGIHSTVRRLVFGDVELRYLGFHTAAYVFSDPTVHAATRNRFCLTDTVNRQLGFYGLRDGRVATFAVHRSDDLNRPSDPRAALREIYGGLGWVTSRALAACPPPSQVYYDHVAQVELPHWSKGRVVLLGDACAAVSLLAGQGASLGMAGAFVLADALRDCDIVADGLARYERDWRPVVTEAQRAGRSAANWFLPTTRAQLILRRVLLRLARLPIANRAVASGIIGKPSTLVRRLADTK